MGSDICERSHLICRFWVTNQCSGNAARSLVDTLFRPWAPSSYLTSLTHTSDLESLPYPYHRLTRQPSDPLAVRDPLTVWVHVTFGRYLTLNGEMIDFHAKIRPKQRIAQRNRRNMYDKIWSKSRIRRKNYRFIR